MKHERSLLRAFCALGYLNFGLLVYMLLGLKGGGVPLFLVIASPVVAIAGSAVYYLFWERLFCNVGKVEGRQYMRPYIVGSILFVGAVLLVYGLAFWADR